MSAAANRLQVTLKTKPPSRYLNHCNSSGLAKPFRPQCNCFASVETASRISRHGNADLDLFVADWRSHFDYSATALLRGETASRIKRRL